MRDEIDEIELVEERASEFAQDLESLFLEKSVQKEEAVGEENKYKNEPIFTPDELSDRRERLVEWLKKNRLPVKIEPEKNEQFTINILDTVFIKAPYFKESCESTNEMILDKVRKLVENLK